MCSDSLLYHLVLLSFYLLVRSLYNLLVAKEKGAQFQVRRDALRSVKSSLESAVQRYRGWRQQVS